MDGYHFNILRDFSRVYSDPLGKPDASLAMGTEPRKAAKTMLAIDLTEPTAFPYRAPMYPGCQILRQRLQGWTAADRGYLLLDRTRPWTQADRVASLARSLNC